MCERGNTIGSRIEELRTEKGLTQAQLAKVMCVRRETVVQWESNTRDLKTKATVALAVFFDVTCDFILRGVAAENVDIHKDLGLSDEAIDCLRCAKMMKDARENHRSNIPMDYHWSDIMSLMIEHSKYYSPAINYFENLLNNHYSEMNEYDIEDEMFEKCPEVWDVISGKALIIYGREVDDYLRSHITRAFEGLVRLLVSKSRAVKSDEWDSYENLLAMERLLSSRTYNDSVKDFIEYTSKQSEEGQDLSPKPNIQVSESEGGTNGEH